MCRLSDVLIQCLLNRLLRHIANYLLFYLATLKYQQRRDAAHSVAHRRGIIAVHIHLADLYLADRKSTRLNSSHLVISYAVFCLKKKKKNYKQNLEHLKM